MDTESARALLAEDRAVVRARLKAVLGTANGAAVVGEAKTPREAVALVEQAEPDVVVIDLTAADVHGIDMTRQIVAKRAAPRVLVLTTHTEKESIARALAAAASDHRRTSADHRESAAAERARYEKLTDRERTVLQLFAEGYSAPDIGERLLISPKTVDTYKQRINEKLGLTSRPEYVRFALKLGLLSPEGSAFT